MRILPIFFLILAINGCSQIPFDVENNIPFQIYQTRLGSCDSGKDWKCSQKEFWGYDQRKYERNGRKVFLAGFRFEDMTRLHEKISLGNIALMYGIALSTINEGATHFILLPDEDWGDWVFYQSSPQIDIEGTLQGDRFRGAGEISGGGLVRRNRDHVLNQEGKNMTYFTNVTFNEMREANQSRTEGKNLCLLVDNKPKRFNPYCHEWIDARAVIEKYKHRIKQVGESKG